MAGRGTPPRGRPPGGRRPRPLDASARARTALRVAAAGTILAGVLVVVLALVAVRSSSASAIAAAAYMAVVLLGSIAAFAAVQDDVHGHRGGTGPATRIEGVLVLGAAAAVAIASLRRLSSSADDTVLAVVALAASSAAAAVGGVLTVRAGVRLATPALARGGDHLRSGALVCGAAAAAVGLRALADVAAIDALGGLGIAALIGRSGLELARPAGAGRPVTAEEVDAVARAIARGPGDVIGYRTVHARDGILGRRLDVVATVRADVRPSAEHRLATALARRAAAEAGGSVRVRVRLVRVGGAPRRAARR